MPETIRRRVFISSVMEGFEDIREAARQGITNSGAEAVLIEDFLAADSSPRNACLDGVRSSDALLLIIGKRGGWVAPSGNLVVEEEYNEARRCKLPTFLFVQNISHDDTASDLKKRLSDYIDGKLRATFDGSEDLPEKIRSVFVPYVERLTMQPRDTSEIQSFLISSEHTSQSSVRVRTAVIIERSEVIEEIASAANAKAIYRIGFDHGLFSMEFAVRHREGADFLILEQYEGDRQGTVRDSITLSERGSIFIESSLDLRDLSNRNEGSNYFLESMVIDTALMERRVAAALDFCGGVFDKFDPFVRFARYFTNVSLLNYGGKLTERNPQPRSSISIPMYADSEPVIAYDQPLLILRDDLRNSGPTANQAVTRIERRINASRQNY